MWNKKYLKYKAKYQALKLKMTGGCSCGMPGCQNGSKCGESKLCECKGGLCKCKTSKPAAPSSSVPTMEKTAAPEPLQLQIVDWTGNVILDTEALESDLVSSLLEKISTQAEVPVPVDSIRLNYEFSPLQPDQEIGMYKIPDRARIQMTNTMTGAITKEAAFFVPGQKPIMATFMGTDSPADTQVFDSIEELRRYGDFNILESVTIRGISTIPAHAFQNRDWLREVTIEEPVNRIEREAFMGCKKLRKVFIKPLIVTFGPDVFKNAGLTKGKSNKVVKIKGKKCTPQEDLEIYASDEIYSKLATQYPGMSFMHAVPEFDPDTFREMEIGRGENRIEWHEDDHGTQYEKCGHNKYIDDNGIIYKLVTIDGVPGWYVRDPIVFDEEDDDSLDVLGNLRGTDYGFGPR